MSDEQPTTEPTQVDDKVIPPKVLPVIVAIVGAAAVCTQVVPPHTIAFKVCSAIVAFGTLLGIASPGLRRKGE